jgi:hypothetical protein
LEDQVLSMLRGQLASIISGAVFLFMRLLNPPAMFALADFHVFSAI